MDVHDKETRSRNMRAIRNRDTRPEHHVRKLLHHNGFRFRLYPADLPGKPDIWMAKWR
ncbi:very short patch repair endonuclease, partial [Escherichia coli]|nr:very short patch repair endonuclease [Escherichia coli]